MTWTDDDIGRWIDLYQAEAEKNDELRQLLLEAAEKFDELDERRLAKWARSHAL